MKTRRERTSWGCVAGFIVMCVLLVSFLMFVSVPTTTVPVTKPQATEPLATEPQATEPQATEPQATKPLATEPQATEPQATEPQATEPQATKPSVPCKSGNNISLNRLRTADDPLIMAIIARMGRKLGNFSLPKLILTALSIDSAIVSILPDDRWDIPVTTKCGFWQIAVADDWRQLQLCPAKYQTLVTCLFAVRQNKAAMDWIADPHMKEQVRKIIYGLT